jgi:hypothetical protein
VQKPLSAKEITLKKPNQSAPKAHLNGNRQERVGTASPIPSEEPAVLPKKDPFVTARRVAAKTVKSANRLPQTASGSDPEKLVCRHCGSDDLARSFIKRRDARCPHLFQTTLRLGDARQVPKVS